MNFEEKKRSILPRHLLNNAFYLYVYQLLATKRRPARLLPCIIWQVVDRVTRFVRSGNVINAIPKHINSMSIASE